jgi:cytochrome P450
VLDLARQDEEYGQQATVPELVNQVKAFLFAGQDTTAATISWIFYYLSLYPEIHAKMRAEHDVILGPFIDTASLAEKLSSDSKLLPRLEYTLAVMKEVLRLRSVGDGARQGPPGYIIRTENGVEFDLSDLMIIVQHHALHTDQYAWGPTASQFDPERFMHGKTVPIGYIPFSTRPKDCIGRNLAYLEVSSLVFQIDHR